MSRRTLTQLWFAALPLLLFPILLRAGTGGGSPKPGTAAAKKNEGERIAPNDRNHPYAHAYACTPLSRR